MPDGDDLNAAYNACDRATLHQHGDALNLHETSQQSKQRVAEERLADYCVDARCRGCARVTKHPRIPALADL